MPMAEPAPCSWCKAKWRYLVLVHADAKQLREQHRLLLLQILTTEALQRMPKESSVNPGQIREYCQSMWQQALTIDNDHSHRPESMTAPALAADTLPTASNAVGDRESQRQDIKMMARRLAKTGACVCLLCAGPILGSRQVDAAPAVSRLQSRSTSGSSTQPGSVLQNWDWSSVLDLPQY